MLCKFLNVTMKKILVLAIIVTIGGFIFPSCKTKKGCTDPNSISYDKEAEENDGSCQYAGAGGQTTIVAKPEHHGLPIISKVGWPDSAFIKFNTQNSPGQSASSYDLVVAGEIGEDHVHIPNMKPGKYYIQVTGYDSTILQRVLGGIPYIVTQASGEVKVVVPVVE